MSNFFFGNKETALLGIEPKNNIYSTHPCLNPDESRTFHKGKSFRCWEWELQKDRLFINDEFFQDFVIYKGNVYMCVNNTTTIPGTSLDWVLFLKPPKGIAFKPILDEFGNLSWEEVVFEVGDENIIDFLPKTSNIRGSSVFIGKTYLDIQNPKENDSYINNESGVVYKCVSENPIKWVEIGNLFPEKYIKWTVLK